MSKLIKPRHNMPSMLSGFDRFFGTLFDDDFFSIPANVAHQGLKPALDISEEDNNLLISAELPGVSEQDIDINIKDGMLTISGEKKTEKEIKESNYYRTERSFGKFSRSIVLNTEVDVDNINATFKNGVLNIALPKIENKQVKKINITT